jgi:hypothetical protein
MKTKDFTTTIAVDQTPEEVFNAIINVRGWWSEEIEGGTAQLHDVFTYRYQDVHLAQIKLVEVIPGKKVVWQVLYNRFNFTKDPTEWTDTTISFEIAEKDGKTQLRFTHHGLTSEYQCYDICHESWTNYIKRSLYSLITTGKGQPNPKEGDGFNARLVEEWNLEGMI